MGRHRRHRDWGEWLRRFAASLGWAVAAVALAVVGLLLIAHVGEANAAVKHPLVAHWQMNERKGHTLRDSSSNHLAGFIGRHVILNGHDHRFPPIARGVFQRGRIDFVPDNPLLDPGDASFSVRVQFLWNQNDDNNLIQKGQGDPAGGMFKMKTTATGSRLPGYIYCLFRGSTGDSTVSSEAYPRLDDGQWHVVLCKRTITGTAMWVDGVQVDTNDNDPGTISNDWPVSIGGNKQWAPGQEPNYFWGRIGDVQWRQW